MINSPFRRILALAALVIGLPLGAQLPSVALDSACYSLYASSIDSLGRSTLVARALTAYQYRAIVRLTHASTVFCSRPITSDTLPGTPGNAAPVADYTITCVPGVSCTGNAAPSTDDQGFGQLTFAWFASNGRTGRTGQTATYDWKPPGDPLPNTFSLSVIATDSLGVADTTTKAFNIPDSVIVAPPPAQTGYATLPQDSVNMALPPTPTRIINVNAGANLQTVFDTAQRGDHIVLEAGATFVGNFVIPAKTGTGWLTVTSSGTLPGPGVRVRPVDSLQMGSLRTAQNGSTPALSIAQGATHVRITGVEVTATSGVTTMNAMVLIGDPNANHSVTAPASNIIFDRMYIHGNAVLNLVRCINQSSDYTAIVNSWLADCHATGQDAQAIVNWNGNCPCLVENNFLEGSGENIMYGGSIPDTPNLIPHDIIIRRNHFYSPESWIGTQWLKKNNFELKFARRVLIEDNVIENSWINGQTGYAVNIKTSAAATMTWGVTRDVTMRYNIIRNAGAGISLSSYDGGYGIPMSNLEITNNLIYNINIPPWNGASRHFQILGNGAPIDSLEISNNTMANLPSGTGISFDGANAATRFVFRNNIFGHGQYGIHASGGGVGMGSMTLAAPGATVGPMGIIGTASASVYPVGTVIVANDAAAGFVDYVNGNYALTGGSPFVGLGADVATILARTAGVVVIP